MNIHYDDLDNYKQTSNDPLGDAAIFCGQWNFAGTSNFAAYLSSSGLPDLSKPCFVHSESGRDCVLCLPYDATGFPDHVTGNYFQIDVIMQQF